MEIRKCECGSNPEPSKSWAYWLYRCFTCGTQTYNERSIERDAIQDWNEGKVE